ncbi:hypothetical protein [Microbacterium sp. BH-3-3-3]|uniref:hypothetical protein n=1 Tax=Microbacterium sp. BH-3-3-3 TaxID=1906742 RepID=UPI00089294A3|nr:hypothetical protein [Microbacterium sp. BH-3-3-3]AOX46706.1 hypothetical protein BJP65_13630 [Microbacterium sp. BH-3-3-3]
MATIYAIRSVDRTLQKQIRQQTKRVAAPEWTKALAERADTRLEHRVIVGTAVVTVSNQNVRIQAAGKGRALKGGLQPKRDYNAVEFGANTGKLTYQRRSRNGGTHRVTRVINTQLKPHAGKRGYVFWPTAREMVPRMGRLWVQTTVRTIANALEGKQE